MSNYNNPKITVLMPVYNCELYIKEAVESILNQTYADFEFLILDDASTDKTVSIIKPYNDSRIKLIEKPRNTGLTNSLNYGLTLAKGKYIARMDGDDISLPERFAKQVAFLENNEDVVVCGTLYKIIGSDRICNHPFDHEAIKVKLITGCYIAHPTVMMRSSFLKRNNIRYSEEMEPAEDHYLWSQIAFIGKLANLNEVLLHYRVHESQMSSIQGNRQIGISKNIKLNMLQKLINNLTNDDLSFLFLSDKNISSTVKKRIELLKKLECQNKSKKIYQLESFKIFINEERRQLIQGFYDNRNKSLFFERFTIFFYSGHIFKVLGLKNSLIFLLKS